jgi:diketogulonate reductase-like aldo/keto reductase
MQIPPQTWSDPSTAFERTKAAVELSVKRIGFPSIDLMLLHAPGPAAGRAEAWRALEEAHKQVRNFAVKGLVRKGEGSEQKDVTKVG